MIMFLRLVTLTAAILVPAILLSWTEDFHWQFGLPALVVLLLCDTMIGKLRQRNLPQLSARRRQHLGVNILHEMSASLAKGLAVVVIMASYFFVIQQIPGIRTPDPDVDRPQLESLLADLEASNRWLDAERAIADRFEQPISEPWKQELAHRQVRCIVLAARSRPTVEARALLKKAIDRAIAQRLSTDLPDAELRALDAADALAKHQQEGLAATTRLQTDLSSQKQQELKSLTASHQAALAAYKANLIAAWAKGSYDELLRFGENLESLIPHSAKREYEAASALAAKYSLDGGEAAIRTRRVDATLQSNQPQRLPDGAQGRILARYDNFLPSVLAADLSVTDSAGRLLAGLQAKDIQITQDGKRLSQIAMTQAQSASTPWQIAIVLDRSDSMRGKPLDEAKAGIHGLISHLPAGTSVRLYSFSTKVDAHTAWTKELRSVQSALKPLVTEGGTSLYVTLSKVAFDMAELSGPRAVVLVTDGRDSSGQPIRADHLTDLKRHGVPWHVVGLQSGDLDTRTLTQIAEASGGSYVTAGQTAELATRLSKISESLRAEFYRVVVLGIDPARPVTLSVGREPAIQFNLQPVQ